MDGAASGSQYSAPPAGYRLPLSPVCRPAETEASRHQYILNWNNPS